MKLILRKTLAPVMVVFLRGAVRVLNWGSPRFDVTPDEVEHTRALIEECEQTITRIRDGQAKN